MSPSFGWLQAFLCGADHLDYQRAAKDLEVNATIVRQRVHKLEAWLHKLLILDNPTELNEGDGVQFISIAWEALRRFKTACSDSDVSVTGIYPTGKTKIISNIRLHDFERFIALSDEGTYKGAADVLKCDVSTIHRSVKDLENATGNKLISGRVTVQLSDSGAALKDTASFIVKSLNEFRAIILDDHDRSLANMHNLHKDLRTRQIGLRLLSESISKTGKKQRGKVRLEDVNRTLDFVTKGIENIEQNFGHFPSRTAKDIDMSQVVALPKADTGA